MKKQSQDSQIRQGLPASKSLAILDPTKPHKFIKPVKKINEGHDVPYFLTSRAYVDIGTFVMQLNIAMCPRRISGPGAVDSWPLDLEIPLPESVRQLQELLQSIDAIIEEAPPDTGPRRFGNVSFRKWYEILDSRIEGLLQKHLPADVLSFASGSGQGPSAIDELKSYLMGGFGSSQRLDYGTGHELSFLAFLGCIWKLGGFTREQPEDGALERSIVLAVIEPYFRVIRRLILTYTLEPAGSHGVWGLDDHSFLPYIFGSSQYCPAISDEEPMPVEGSLPDSPNPADVTKKTVVNRERTHNMYFSAVGFINDVKTGPFWEHSPILFDISGVRSGWGKINKGMIKMYNAEVLSKFPVVQHFPFGSLFKWEQDPNAAPVPTSIHAASQPPSVSESTGNTPTSRFVPQAQTEPPSSARQEGTKAPWEPQPSGSSMAPTAAPWARPGAVPPPGAGALPPTRAPWASNNSLIGGPSDTRAGRAAALPSQSSPPEGPTRAPWADRGLS